MELLQNYYPETLRHVFIVNAPYLFTTVWNIARVFINEQVTAQRTDMTLRKFHILGQDYQTVLLEYISAENLPKFLGGSCECKHISGGCVPSSNMGNIPKLPEDIDNERVETTYTTEVVSSWKK
ncbi:cytosolic factor, phosphatidylinositol/phosphatidylcholine transfer protein [Apophysomyces ossiformis]|uniref:Cytosolic factor, phosphatidylinositol/phosphatidylcholine transfer protein n=1 Tax=Apophysomyces ossiformis TaxID=679940 RepID=A0A8H7EU32_9FUNG|nr:cytosolic factor, phosphatidylinositol/phosphatidylcholine transfer protein [Apophysomyces ossiformis]